MYSSVESVNETTFLRYKKQIEDAEEIAALNLAKFRKAQQQLEEADERTQNAEAQIQRIRSERAGSMLVRAPFFFFKYTLSQTCVGGFSPDMTSFHVPSNSDLTNTAVSGYSHHLSAQELMTDILL